MTAGYRFVAGDLPLIVSIPHDGRRIPAAIAANMNEAGLAIPDTDWDVAELYEFATAKGAHLLVANFSRYVVDLNRSAGDGVLYPDQVVTGLCPELTFAGEEIYKDGMASRIDAADRLAKFWRPYHDKLEATLQEMRNAFGYALLWDAHSIPSVVPRLFDGALPELNIGTHDGRSCDADRQAAVLRVADASDYSWVANDRFKGGYITRHYGSPENGIHALQLEIAQRAYRDEDADQFSPRKAAKLRATLDAMLDAYLDPAKR